MQLHLFRTPIDGLRFKFDAEPLRNFFCQIDIVTDDFAVGSTKAERRERIVESEHKYAARDEVVKRSIAGGSSIPFFAAGACRRETEREKRS